LRVTTEGSLIYSNKFGRLLEKLLALSCVSARYREEGKLKIKQQTKKIKPREFQPETVSETEF